MQPDFQQQTIPQPSNRWKKRLGCGCAIFFMVTALLAGAAVFFSLRESETTTEASQGFSVLESAFQGEVTGGQLLQENDPKVGPEDAQVTVIEFSDFECPFCRTTFPIIRELMVRYGDRVRFIYRDFPLDDMHTHARRAGEAAQCAHAQLKFWEYHDKLFQNQPRFTDTDLKQYARSVGLDGDAFDRCLESRQMRDRVHQDFVDGVSLGIRGTPTWFINGQKVEGVIPRETFVQIIESLLE